MNKFKKHLQRVLAIRNNGNTLLLYIFWLLISQLNINKISKRVIICLFTNKRYKKVAISLNLNFVLSYFKP